MSDDKSKLGRDRKFIARGEPYEVRQFADKHGISIELAEKLIKEHGNSREALDAAAAALKA